MAITTTWGISQMNCYPELDGETDVVFQVHWTLTADDGEGHTNSVYGSVGVQLNPEEPFTPYAELTEPQVVSWVQAALGAEQCAEYEAGVTSMVEAQINPPVVTPPLPWLPVAEEAPVEAPAVE